MENRNFSRDVVKSREMRGALAEQRDKRLRRGKERERERGRESRQDENWEGGKKKTHSKLAETSTHTCTRAMVHQALLEIFTARL